MFIPSRKISESFTKEQINYLREIYQCCIDEGGATSKQLWALGGLVFIDWHWKLTEHDIKFGQKLYKEIIEKKFIVENTDE